MIQINLLPDIKRQYLRSQQVKGFFILGAFAISAATVAAAVLMWFFTLGQNIHLDNLQEDIDKGISELQAIEDLDKVVTVQNQLSVIESLYDKKPEVALLFDYLSLMTPDVVSLGAVEFEHLEANMAEITGVGENFKSINRFVDIMKNATYTHKDLEEPTKAFTGVVLQTSGSQDDNGETGFKISMTFDPMIFDNNLENLKISIPNITSTQSETQRPKSLFDSDAQQIEPDAGFSND